MTPGRRERRSNELHPLPPSYRGLGERRSQPGSPPTQIFDTGTGFYTMAALAEFIQYEIDGSAQTLRNELYVTPLCLVAIEVAGLAEHPDEEQRRMLEVAGEAVRRITRAADRAAADGDRFVVLLRRTLARNVRDHYAPRLAAAAEAAAGGAGAIRLSAGISSLVEHLVRDPGDMVRKALRALAEARQHPGSAVIYDFRVMPLD